MHFSEFRLHQIGLMELRNTGFSALFIGEIVQHIVAPMCSDAVLSGGVCSEA